MYINGTRDSTALGATLASPKAAQVSSPKAVTVTRSPAMFNVVFIPCIIAHSRFNLTSVP